MTLLVWAILNSLCQENEKKKNERKHRKADRKDKLFGPLLSKYPVSKDLA